MRVKRRIRFAQQFLHQHGMVASRQSLVAGGGGRGYCVAPSNEQKRISRFAPAPMKRSEVGGNLLKRVQTAFTLNVFRGATRCPNLIYGICKEKILSDRHLLLFQFLLRLLSCRQEEWCALLLQRN